MKLVTANSLRAFRVCAVAASVLGAAHVLRADTLATGSAAVVTQEAADGSSTPFTRDHLIASLTQAIASHFNLEGDLQLELLRTWTPPARVATSWDISVVEYPSVTSSSMMVRCRILADKVQVTETTFVVRAQLWRDAWATRQPLTIGASFDAGVLEARRVDLFRDRDALPAAVGDRSYIFTRAVPAGRLLTWRDIARRPLVRKGDLVEVSAVDGLLAVTMKGLAMENGAQGDTVTVRNPISRKDFVAMVIDENRVQVRF
ncbi:MAG: flagellar basal body P-ring formation chaperone FlgA [Verrucomicrobiota bacterium]